MKCSIEFKNGQVTEVEMSLETKENVCTYTLENSVDYKDVGCVTVFLNDEPIPMGTDGFYLFPATGGKLQFDAIGYFKEREDFEFLSTEAHLPIMGYKTEDDCVLAVSAGLPSESRATVYLKDSKYSLAFRYVPEKDLYEDLKIELHHLSGKDATYSGMARAYRRRQLEVGGFNTIKDRLTDNLKYVAESILVRIRMGWKPVPCTVLEQTPETEPEMHVACTFKDVINIMRDYKAAGIDKVEFQLVGWNISGHDGRWPQILPVEEKFGGEEGLREVAKVAKELGYVLSCHTNSTDAYTIANNFDWDDMAIGVDGKPSILAEYWSGGRAYKICPKCAIELTKKTLPPVKELGFNGSHYIDVITTVLPHTCYNEKHKVNSREASKYWAEVLDYARNLFGAIGSEGGFDYALQGCDFSLYTTFGRDYKLPDCFDEMVPFWQIAYHGLVLSNPFPSTINAPLSTDKNALVRIVENGGRPVIYYYSRFVDDGKDWIGDVDFIVDESKRERNVNAAKELDKILKDTAYLQYEFMEDHRKIADGVYEVEYSDGSTVTVDYNNNTYSIKK